MPKLSAATLNKMFKCPQCGKSFRTRQGLSGHIQFKHRESQTLTNNDKASQILRFNKLKAMFEITGFSESESTNRALIEIHWQTIQQICETMFNVVTYNQDYKNYVISSLARISENERLKENLTASFKNLLNVNNTELKEELIADFKTLLEEYNK